MPRNYYQMTEYVSNSDLTQLRKAAAAQNIERVDARFLIIGSVVDAMMTEPSALNLISHTYTNHEGTTYTLTEEEWYMCEQMTKSLREESVVKQLLKYGKLQDEIYVAEHEMEYLGDCFTLPMRCKVDVNCKTVASMADFKTTACRDYASFRNTIHVLDYDRQAALYLDLGKAEHFWIIAASKKYNPVKARYEVFKHLITRDSEFYHSGKQKYVSLAHLYANTIMI